LHSNPIKKSKEQTHDNAYPLPSSILPLRFFGPLFYFSMYYRVSAARYNCWVQTGWTGGDDEKNLSCPTLFIGHPSWFPFGWMPTYNGGHDN